MIKKLLEEKGVATVKNKKICRFFSSSS